MTKEILQNIDNLSIEELMQHATAYVTGDGVEPDDAIAHTLFQKAAELGDAAAQYSTAKGYEFGLSVEQDYQKALEWYTKSDEQGYGHASSSIGNFYFEGKGVEKDLAKAFEYYVRGASMGSMEATYSAGMSMLYGYGTEINEENGLRYLAHAADNGYTLAQQAIATYLEEVGGGYDEDDDEDYDDEEDTDENSEETMKHVLENMETLTTEQLIQWAQQFSDEWGGYTNLAASHMLFEQAAIKGDPYAMYCTGYNYQQGRSVPVDYNQAKFWYQQGIDQGHHAGYKGMGDLYFEGQGVDQDYEKAFELYYESGGLGSLDGQYICGVCLENGYGVERNLERAKSYYNHAAQNGHYLAPDALARVEQLIEEEAGRPEEFDMNSYQMDPDMVKGINEAAEAGDPISQMSMAGFYQSGMGVEQDNEKAIYWYTRAADAGNGDAAFMLGTIYHYGMGTDVDLDKARKYYQIATDNGNESASAMLATL